MDVETLDGKAPLLALGTIQTVIKRAAIGEAVPRSYTKYTLPGQSLIPERLKKAGNHTIQ